MMKLPNGYLDFAYCLVSDVNTDEDKLRIKYALNLMQDMAEVLEKIGTSDNSAPMQNIHMAQSALRKWKEWE